MVVRDEKDVTVKLETQNEAVARAVARVCK